MKDTQKTKKFLLCALGLSVACGSFAEDLGYNLKCKDKHGVELRTPKRGYGSPYYFSKKTLLELVVDGEVEQQFIVQGNEFDLEAQVAHGSGEYFNNQAARFRFNLNMATGVATLKLSTYTTEKSYVFDHCSYSDW